MGLNVLHIEMGGSWRQTAPKIQPKVPPELRSSTHQGGIGKRVQKKGLNLWYGRVSLRQPPMPANPFFETSESRNQYFLGQHASQQKPKQIAEVLASQMDVGKVAVLPSVWCFRCCCSTKACSPYGLATRRQRDRLSTCAQNSL